MPNKRPPKPDNKPGNPSVEKKAITSEESKKQPERASGNNAQTTSADRPCALACDEVGREIVYKRST